ncbi:MAG: ABC transporter ATP-binding protein [bacterium]
MVIDIQHIHKVYSVGEMNVTALDDVSLGVERGDFVAIMGASGSGKSTLLNILGCLDHPTSGSYRLDETEVSGMTQDQLAHVRNHKLGFIFQNFNLLSRTSALENVELPLLYGAPLSHAARRRKALEMLDRMDLGSRVHHFPGQLSGGQQQRVAIARALVNGPALILADEPTGNLDSRSSNEIMKLFQEVNAQGLTIIMVTHETDVARYARRTLQMRDGRFL